MNHSVLFTVPDHPGVAAQRALSVIEELGAPMKSDSGHFVTGAVPYPGGSIEVLISWLPSDGGTQITVQTTGDDAQANGVFKVADRVRETYLSTKSTPRRSRGSNGNSVTAFIVVLSLFLVVGMFFFILTHH